MKYTWWDSCNKWLYFGTAPDQRKRFVLMFDEWISWFYTTTCTFHEWTLFSIHWDRGVWWADDLNPVEFENKQGCESIPIKWQGKSNCYIQIKLFGIGLRMWYKSNTEILMVPDTIKSVNKK